MDPGSRIRDPRILGSRIPDPPDPRPGTPDPGPGAYSVSDLGTIATDFKFCTYESGANAVDNLGVAVGWSKYANNCDNSPRGAITLNGQPLWQGDGAAISAEPALRLIGLEPAEVLVFDLG